MTSEQASLSSVRSLSRLTVSELVKVFGADSDMALQAMLAVLLRSHVAADVAAQQEDNYNPGQLGMPVLADHRFLILPDTPLTLPMPPGRVDLVRFLDCLNKETC
jgi:hypothetical protein